MGQAAQVVSPSVAEPPAETSPAAGLRGEALSARHRQVASLLGQLATTGRSFLLYDIRNDTVRRALATLLEAFASTLAAEPQLRLEIAPFEIFFDGRRVYLDWDRERSLAFRLYRDGVRALVFRQGFDADQLARLLEILSVRYTGIHQHEDDTVTLLWKAGLPGLDVVAVEGLTPEGGLADPALVPRAREPRPYLPEDIDPPVTDAAVTVAPERLELEPWQLGELRAEVAPGRLADDALALLEGMTLALEDPAEGLRLSETVHLCEEIRDFLLSASNLPALLRFVRALQRLSRSNAPWDPERHAGAVALLVSCGSDRSVRRLVHSVPSGDTVLRGELVEVLDVVCSDPLTAVAAALAVEDRPSSRAIGRQLLEHYGRRRGALLREQFGSAQGRTAADFLRSIARLEGEEIAPFVARQCGHRDPEVREEALWHLERTAHSSVIGHALVEAVRHTAGEHRRRLLALVERSRDRRFVKALVALLHTEARDLNEARELARVVGRLEGEAGLERWTPALTPHGRLFRRRLPGSVVEQVGAATAVAQVPGDEATHLLRLALSAAAAEARPWILQLLQERAANGTQVAT